MGINTGTSLEGVKELIEKVKSNATTLTTDTIQSQIQSGIVDTFKESWYAEDAVYFMNSLGSVVYALTSEIAVQVNTVIYNIAGAYDYWLKSTSGQSDVGAGDYDQSVGTASSIQADPNNNDGQSVNGAGGYIEIPNYEGSSTYTSTSGGDGRNGAYSYLSSEDTQVKIDVSAIKAESPNHEVGIDTEVANSVMGALSGIKEAITTQLSSMQSELDATAAVIDASGQQAAAVSDFYKAVGDEISKMFEFITEGENSLSSSINKTIEKYGTTIVSGISDSLANAASGDGSES